MISDEAVEAAAKAVYAEAETIQTMGYATVIARAALEAAAPILLSHEREETRLAHIDAVVNRDSVDRLERELETAKADAWDEAATSIIDEHGNPIQPTNVTNPYRSQS